MNAAPAIFPQAPADRFARIILGLLRCVGARVSRNLSTGGFPGVGMAPLPAAVAALLYARIDRAGRLFAALAERLRLGTARTHPHRSPPQSRPRPEADPTRRRGARDPDVARLPRGFGAVVGLLYWEAAFQAELLRQFLADPTAADLIRSLPGFARILRPLCRMLGVVPPDGLFPPLPRRERRRRAPRACRPVSGVVKAGGPQEGSARWRLPHPARRAKEWHERVAPLAKSR